MNQFSLPLFADQKLISPLTSTADYLIEAEPIINKFISVPKDKGVLNCAAFISGIIEAILIESNFVSSL